jgi:hypothetical protein
MGRKVGVGFNHPMVLGGRCQHDWRKFYAFARRLTGIRAKRRHWQTVPGGLVETLRTYRRP